MKARYFIFNLKTNTVSKKSWATYRGACKNSTNLNKADIVTTKEGVD